MKPLSHVLHAACLFCAATIIAGAQQASPKFKLETKETLLTNIEKSFVPDSLTVSPDMYRVAYVFTREKENRVSINGSESAPYTDIDSESLRFSPDSKRLAFVACKGGKLLNGADVNARTGRAHHMITGVDLAVVVDRHEYNGWSAVDPNSLVFSPDSQKIVFVARKGMGAWKLYIDGKESTESYDDVACLLTPPTVRFSADGKHMAFAAIRNGRFCVVVDGKPIGDYDSVIDDTIVFSPDGRSIAFAAARGDRQFVVQDAKEQPEVASIAPGSVVFSPNGKRLGYLASTTRTGGEARWRAVIDGAPGKEMTLSAAGSPEPADIMGNRLRFSPDGARHAWELWHNHAEGSAGTAAIGAQMVVDNVAGPAFRSLLSDPVFSPDSRRLAYLVAKGNPPPPKPYGDVRLSVDGQEGRKYFVIDYPSVCFSPDSRYTACVGWTPKREARIVVNDVEGPVYLNFVAIAPYGQRSTPLSLKTELVFTGPRTLVAAAYKHWTIVRLETTIVEQ